jgi:hypothetical protein
VAEPGGPGQGSEIAREEVEAVLEVRKELGPSYDVALVDAFAERIEEAVAERVDARIAHEQSLERHRLGDKQRQLALGIVSLGVSIPITIPLAVNDQLSALLISWLGIVAVNAAHAVAVNGPARRALRRQGS